MSGDIRAIACDFRKSLGYIRLDLKNIEYFYAQPFATENQKTKILWKLDNKENDITKASKLNDVIVNFTKEIIQSNDPAEIRICLDEFIKNPNKLAEIQGNVENLILNIKTDLVDNFDYPKEIQNYLDQCAEKYHTEHINDAEKEINESFNRMEREPFDVTTSLNSMPIPPTNKQFQKMNAMSVLYGAIFDLKQQINSINKTLDKMKPKDEVLKPKTSNFKLDTSQNRNTKNNGVPNLNEISSGIMQNAGPKKSNFKQKDNSKDPFFSSTPHVAPPTSINSVSIFNPPSNNMPPPGSIPPPDSMPLPGNIPPPVNFDMPIPGALPNIDLKLIKDIEKQLKELGDEYHGNMQETNEKYRLIDDKFNNIQRQYSNQFNQLEAAIEDYNSKSKNKFAETNDNVSKISSQFKEMKTQILTFETKFFEKTQAQQKDLRDSISQEIKTYNDLKISKKDFEDEISRLKQELSNSFKTIDSLTAKVNDLEIRKETQINANYERDIKKLKSDYQLQSKELQTAKGTIESLTRIVNELKNRNGTQENNDYEGRFQNLSNQLDELRAELQEKDNIIDNLMKEKKAQLENGDIESRLSKLEKFLSPFSKVLVEISKTVK